MAQESPTSGPQATHPRRLYLIGMPGSGKSTIARSVASALGWTWIDTDACVERLSHIPIPEIFARDGEDVFRKREWECVRQAAKTDQAVISCGGGVPCFFNAIDLLLNTGLVIYLHASPDVLLRRLSTGIADRPLLMQKGSPPERILAHMLEQREAAYLKSHSVIRTNHLSVEAVSGLVLEYLRK